MGFSSISIFLFFLVALLHFQLSESATVVVDGVSEWKNPQVQMGDSVLFQHKFHYNLYIFRNQDAFSLCNFTQATLLTNPNSTSYTWHTSRPGFFYFSFNNGSNRPCLEGQKLAVKVSLPRVVVVAAPPISGGIMAPSPAFSWPFQPREIGSPSPAPGSSLPGTNAVAPDREGVPFINSNPAVPLPTGEVDSATIRPLPTSDHQHSKQVVGFSAVQMILSCIILMV
ncbi:hypothetical protein CDL12_24556 [Handroanthus impetiginosus]|uniref:Phytocyanin domain-containing protein n=1 Tax=Handroanthus impetiginosus TaxID=429701 RepID=A0A2G9GCA4_9LAMI|nr:hypothetical protein CDL12_24556 [Handroanthus impetiginosus]